MVGHDSAVVAPASDSAAPAATAIDSLSMGRGILSLEVKAKQDSVWIQVFSDGVSWKNWIKANQTKRCVARDSFNIHVATTACWNTPLMGNHFESRPATLPFSRSPAESRSRRYGTSQVELRVQEPHLAGLACARGPIHTLIFAAATMQHLPGYSIARTQPACTASSMWRPLWRQATLLFRNADPSPVFRRGGHFTVRRSERAVFLGRGDCRVARRSPRDRSRRNRHGRDKPRVPRLGLQSSFFEKHLALGKRFDKPVIVHSRGCERRAFDMCVAARVKRAVFHCYTGDAATMKAIVDAGYFVSFSGIVTFRNRLSIRWSQWRHPIRY